MKIDDLKINSYVDGELNEQELKNLKPLWMWTLRLEKSWRFKKD